jgi:hypothetical protein
MFFKRAAFPSALLLLGLAACSFNPANIDGAYFGLEPMPGYVDPDYPNRLWFRENRLIIRDGGIRLEKFPITVDPGTREIGYPASEGGVFKFEGSIARSSKKLKATLVLTDSANGHVEVGPDGMPLDPKVKSMAVTRQPDGAILLDGVTYRRIRGAKSNETALVIEALNQSEKEQGLE